MLIPVTPSTPVVSLADAKHHLRVEHTDDDAYITALIGAATTAVSERLERTLGATTWDYRIGSDDICWGFDIRLPKPPLIEVVSVKYIDTDGAEQTYAPANYRAFGIGGQGGIRLTGGASWPSLRYGPEAVTIRYRAGYESVPEPIRQAILLMIGQLFASRGEMVPENLTEDPAIKYLLAPYRVFGV
ncbi:head-tail connector protein [Microvirga arsenatis]|uniref:Phage gp6-like head-tail connector protein n=1 Tax=Microvirga arsenatis TaxID=2692265 RepID=A0ABW9YWQ7_9HYPH|nr:phage gp6-like head-tail connector protein [Microvirga arsenatis]NBJ24116.1 phage gp6-like head-tail connector protein [Microvirga arsenatis]